MSDGTESHLIDETELSESTESPTNRTHVMRMARMAAAFAVVLVIGFAGGMQVGAGSNSALANVPFIGDALDATPDPDANFNDFWKAYNILNERFVQTRASSTIPTTKEKLYGAIAGMTASFGDPYTVYMPPEQAKTFQESISGEFGGVGMEVGVRDGLLTVIAPLKGTPAYRAGILAGDGIITIDGKSTEGMSTDAAVKLIRGKKGTSVTFKMLREGDILDITVVRDTIAAPTIDQKYDAENGIYSIAIYEFTATSAGLFDKALAEFRKSGARKLIIDVRGDPGGYLDAAVSMASHFLPQGTTIVTEDYKGKRENVVHRSRGTGGVPQNLEVVVLMDKGSASASEILAGALKDNNVATLIGTRSFGKGSVQELVELGDGALKVTIARWLTPSGNSISDGGLKPDVEVERTAADFKEGKDPQKDRAIEFLKTGK